MIKFGRLPKLLHNTATDEFLSVIRNEQERLAYIYTTLVVVKGIPKIVAFTIVQYLAKYTRPSL